MAVKLPVCPVSGSFRIIESCAETSSRECRRIKVKQHDFIGQVYEKAYL
jgi:hypothetical protein